TLADQRITATPITLAPTLTALNPPSAIGGGTDLSLTLTGTNFSATSVVRWNGNDRATTYDSPTQLRAAITGADLSLANFGPAVVTVFNPAPGGGTSNQLNFNVLSLACLSAASYTFPNQAPDGIVAAYGAY